MNNYWMTNKALQLAAGRRNNRFFMTRYLRWAAPLGLARGR
jgi:hypothetical protein